MKRIKIFQGSASAVERDANYFLDNANIKQVKMQIISSSRGSDFDAEIVLLIEYGEEGKNAETLYTEY
jgi:hypothetical protein